MKSSLWSKFTIYIIFIIFFITIITGISFYYTLSDALKEEVGQKALQIAKTTASRPDVIAGFYYDNPSEVLQPIAKEIRLISESEYVVIGDENGIRYAHPIEDRIGSEMVGGDNEGALEFGLSYISESTGTLGPAIRGKVPVIGYDNDIIGVVSVGYLKTNMNALFFDYIDNIVLIIIFSIVIGIICSFILSKRIKKDLLDYEPIEIAELLKQRNALIESVREGIIMVNYDGVITVANSAAYRALSNSESDSLIGKEIREVIPNTNMYEVLETGEMHFDKPLEIAGKKTIVNRIPIWNGDKVVGAVSSFRLQSEIDGLVMELSQVKKYTEALRAQTHEYNNFLYTISGLVQLQHYDEALNLIHSEREEQGSLIHFISQRIRDSFINGILIGFFNRAKELKVKFIIDEDSKLEPLPKNLQKHLLVSIIGNLLTNAFEAVEHLEKNDRVVRILIVELGGEIVIEVEDSGKGLDEELKGALFERRVSTKGKNKGERGFGLVKISENVKELGGEILIEKGDLGGALFIIVINRGDKS